jgi:hypothetical protein
VLDMVKNEVYKCNSYGKSSEENNRSLERSEGVRKRVGVEETLSLWPGSTDGMLHKLVLI